MAALHPQVVHFTVVLALVGVAFRLLSLLGRRAPAFVSPAASTLLVLAAVSAVVSVRSGTAAHAPVERAPGSRSAVSEHEEWGERTQVVLLLLGGVELLGVVMRRSTHARAVHTLAAVVGLAGVYSVYETGEHGGELVYSYAGGVGIRSGDPKDVERLLLAGLYHQAMAARAAGRAAQAADLVGDAVKHFPSDPEVQMLAAESQVLDERNPQGAIDRLSALRLSESDRFGALRKATLLADAYEALGRKTEAVAALDDVLARFPNPRLQQRADALRNGGSTAR